MSDPNEAQVQVDLVPATAAHKSIFENLLQFYLHDFSEVISLEVGTDGRFDYPHLELYWTGSGRFPFLATADGKWAGFAFMKQIPQSATEGFIWDMAEFFVLRGHRRLGIGIRLAHLAFQQFPGSWQVRVMESNSVACQFWPQVIESFTGASVLPARGWMASRGTSSDSSRRLFVRPNPQALRRPAGRECPPAPCSGRRKM